MFPAPKISLSTLKCDASSDVLLGLQIHDFMLELMLKIQESDILRHVRSF